FFAFAMEYRPIYFHVFKQKPHAVEGAAVAVIFGPTAHPLVPGEGGGLGDAEKLDTMFRFLEVLLKSNGRARS
ncbi:hypothetical protein ACVGXT_04885, partial [Enterobacter intestinihominis]